MLLRMELFKLVKRPMTWVLFVMLTGLVAFVDVVSLLSLNRPGANTDAVLRNVTLPQAIPFSLRICAFFGSILLAILAASAIGSEYSWGTLRPTLSTGISRGRFLGAKVLALALAALVFILAALGVAVVLAVPLAATQGRAVTLGTVDAAWFGALAAMLGRTFLVVFIPMLLAFFFGVAGRSQTVGVGVALGYTIGETVAVPLLGLLGTWTNTIVTLLLGVNSRVLVAHNAFTAVPDAPVGEGPAPFTLTQGHALAVLAVYGIVSLAIATLLFLRSDIRGAA